MEMSKKKVSLISNAVDMDTLGVDSSSPVILFSHVLSSAATVLCAADESMGKSAAAPKPFGALAEGAPAPPKPSPQPIDAGRLGVARADLRSLAALSSTDDDHYNIITAAEAHWRPLKPNCG